MLKWNHPLWDTLEGPYGAANQLQSILHQLTDAFDLAQFQWLFEEYLYHQQSIYSATYVALPHLARIASQTADMEVRKEIFISCGIIEAARRASDDKACVQSLGTHGQEILHSYEQGLTELRALSDTMIADASTADDATDKRYIIIALAALDGYQSEAQMLLTFDTGEEYVFACQHCQEDVYLWPENLEPAGRLYAYKEDPVFHPDQLPVAITPSSAIPEHEIGAQHLHQWATMIQEPVLIAHIPDLTGSCTCPSCQTQVSIWAHLLD